MSVFGKITGAAIGAAGVLAAVHHLAAEEPTCKLTPDGPAIVTAEGKETLNQSLAVSNDGKWCRDGSTAFEIK